MKKNVKKGIEDEDEDKDDDEDELSYNDDLV